MPVNYQISEKSLEKREQILLLCKQSKTLNELSAVTGDTVSSLRFNVKKLTESKHLILSGTKPSYNNQPAKAYMATGLKYEPLLAVHIPKFINNLTKPRLTVVSCNDYHPTRCAPRRREVRTGSTLGSMTF
jgi:hypothetical protein